jgi:hypothetical protein
MTTADATLLSISRRFAFTPGDRASIQGPQVSDADEAQTLTAKRIGRGL